MPGSSVHGIFQARILEWDSHSVLQGNLPDPGIEPRSPALQADSLPFKSPGKPKVKKGHCPHSKARVIQTAPDTDVSENHFLPPYSGVVTTMSSPVTTAHFPSFGEREFKDPQITSPQTHCQPSMLVIFPISCLRISEPKLNAYQGFLLWIREILSSNFTMKCKIKVRMLTFLIHAGISDTGSEF